MHGKRVRAGSPPPSAVDGPCRAPRPASSAPLLQTAPKCSPFQHTAPICHPLVHRAPLCKHRAQALWAPVTSSPTSAPWVVSSLLCAVEAFLAAPLLPTWAPPRPPTPSSLLWVLWFPWPGASPSQHLPSPDSGTHCVPASVLMLWVYLQHPRR